MRGQDQGGDFGELRTDLPRSLKTLGLTARRHPDIDDGQVRTLTDQRHQLAGILGLADDVESCAPQQACDALPEQRVVVSENDSFACFLHHAPVSMSSPWMPGPKLSGVSDGTQPGSGGFRATWTTDSVASSHAQCRKRKHSLLGFDAVLQAPVAAVLGGRCSADGALESVPFWL